MYIKSINEANGMVSVVLCGGNDGECETFNISSGRFRRIASPLAEGLLVDEQIYSEIEHASTVTNAVHTAAQILSVSDKSAVMLMRKLCEKGIDRDCAEEAVEFMVRKGYLNEARQAAVYAESAVRNKLYGKRRISKELYAKGYSKEVIRQTEEELSDEKCSEAMRKYIDRSVRRLAVLDADKMKKIASAAERLGHSPAAALKYMKTIK